MARLGLFTVVLAVLLPPATASAAATPAVAIVRPANPSPFIAETLVRLQGELASVGFVAEIVDDPAAGAASGRASPAWLEHLAALRGVDAVVAVGDEVAPDAARVWVIDKVTGKSLARSVPIEPASEPTPSALAIRALELLRSSFREIDIAPRPPRDTPAAAQPPEVAGPDQRPASRPDRFALEAGGAASTSLDGVGPAILPVVSLSWAARPGLLLQLTAAGLGTRPTVQTMAGSARVAQDYATLGAAYRLRAGRRLEPFVALSAGALHTAVEGQANSPDQGRVAAQWSFLVDGAVGVRLQVHDRFYLTLAAHAQIAEPYLAVRFLDAVVATSGRPNLLVALAIGAWL